jgi:hypothetical protein
MRRVLVFITGSALLTLGAGWWWNHSHREVTGAMSFYSPSGDETRGSFRVRYGPFVRTANLRGQGWLDRAFSYSFAGTIMDAEHQVLCRFDISGQRFSTNPARREPVKSLSFQTRCEHSPNGVVSIAIREVYRRETVYRPTGLGLTPKGTARWAGESWERTSAVLTIEFRSDVGVGRGVVGKGQVRL